MRLVLQRTETGDEGTFGVIEIPSDLGGQTFHTGELPWRGNARGKSCIPAGLYQCRMRRSPKFGDCYILTGPGVLDEPSDDPDVRTFILIHAGNFCGDEDMGYVAHVDGCIILGMTRGVLRNSRGEEQEAVCASGAARKEFERLMGGAEFELEIRDIEE